MITIYDNGQIYTGTLPIKEAFAVEDDRFLFVGNSREVCEKVKKSGKSWEYTDLKQQFVCAGFNDSHMHLLNYGYALSMADLSEHTGSIEELISYMKAYEGCIPGKDDRWLTGRGWNQEYFSGEKRFPDRHDLDRISKKHPVCLTRACGHCCVVNSRALELMGLYGKTPDLTENAGIGLEEGGIANGIFRENAMNLVFEAMPKPSVQDVKCMILKAMAMLNSYGITSCQTDDLACFDIPYTEILKAYRELEAEGLLTVRINEQSQFTCEDDLKKFLRQEWEGSTGSEMFKIGPLKIVSDGSLGARTAWLSMPYKDGGSCSGGPTIDKEMMREMIDLAYRHGMPIAVHAIGDAALDQVLCIYEHLPDNRRNGIVHCQITRSDQLEIIKQMKLHIYAQTIFLDADIPIVHSRVGDTLAESSYAFHSLKEGGCHVSNGSDCPVERPDVLAGIQCAVTRKTLDGQTGPYVLQEAMSVYEALDSYTKEGAFASGEEHLKGTIEPGKLADFVILSQNPADTETNEIKNISVLSAYLGGRCVFRKIPG